MLDAFAWTGVGIAGILLAAVIVMWIYNLLSNPIGRAVALALALLGIAVWGLLGGIYLIMEKVQ